MPFHFRIPAVMVTGLTTLLLCVNSSVANEERTWSEIRPSIIGQSVPEEGAGPVTLIAPTRAEDAAIVPIEVRIRLPDDAGKVTRLTLVVDENPAPVAGVFHLGDGQTAFDVTTRVRVDSYSFVRVIATMDDGRLYMAKSYVKAAGGCSAPALKDPVEAKARLGEMRFRVFADRGDAQVQVRHPNYSGLQMDQVTRLYTPAWFVERLDIRQGEKLLFGLEGGISISEDPTIRFSYRNTGEPVTIEAKDNEGRVFKQTFPAAGS
ncbi:quinoprotein dehydrogenase-associated SoxYZ-like carrier [Microvirga makkahensis]|uniref:Quinoprotein dehydrogenase-associated SoxYZ-like carrier n=1 Tax=Microvirga makkahensis TaxID=1128670 RepID=A0A7X3MRV7_9HYPH|nr:quinoprotein dehydrogenase-associated SoxYZ-like carrier [Microvirga makkahensis]MXQ12074.1 quinoprotein dehydrogenase-associated SoxYZ-like carrier [Microvirga makkahensis]